MASESLDHHAKEVLRKLLREPSSSQFSLDAVPFVPTHQLLLDRAKQSRQELEKSCREAEQQAEYLRLQLRTAQERLAACTALWSAEKRRLQEQGSQLSAEVQKRKHDQAQQEV